MLNKKTILFSIIIVALFLPTISINAFDSSWDEDFENYPDGDLNGNGTWTGSLNYDVTSLDYHHGSKSAFFDSSYRTCINFLGNSQTAGIKEYQIIVKPTYWDSQKPGADIDFSFRNSDNEHLFGFEINRGADANEFDVVKFGGLNWANPKTVNINEWLTIKIIVDLDNWTYSILANGILLEESVGLAEHNPKSVDNLNICSQYIKGNFDYFTSEVSPANNYSGFQPDRDGFDFKNYCSVYFDEELNEEVSRIWEMFTQFFGEEYTMLGDSRRYTAEKYFKEEYAKYDSSKPCGSCDGFSATSLINFNKLDQPNSGSFSMPHYDNLYSEVKTSDMEEAIVYYQGFFFSGKVTPYLNQKKFDSGKSPKFFYEKIKEAINNQESIVVWIWNYPKLWEFWKSKGCHALVPYKYEEDVINNKGYVYVYDSEYPGNNNRIITFDLEKDEWSYKLFWSGNADGSNLSIVTVPIEMYLEKGVAPWAGEAATFDLIYSVNETAAPLFANGNGKRIGFVNDEFVNEIQDAIYLIPPQGQGTEEGSYHLPQGNNYEITLEGKEEGSLDFNVFGHQTYTGLSSTVNENSLDNIKLKGNALTYSTSDNSKEYTAIITREFEDTSRKLEISTTISDGEADTIELNETGTFKYRNDGNNKFYNLTLSQRGNNSGELSILNLEIEENSTHILNLPEETSLENSEIVLGIDLDSDGTIDEEKKVQIVFEDSRRNTKLIINPTDKTFSFIANGKEFSFRKADSMKIIDFSKRFNVFGLGLNFSVLRELRKIKPNNEQKELIIIRHRDKDINLMATAITGETDFCSAYARDKKARKSYFLIDKVGKE